MRNKTNNVYITIKDETKCLVEWCEIFDVDFYKAWARYRILGVTDINRLFYKGDLRDLRPHILQLTLDGEVIAEYEKITHASRKNGIATNKIRKVCEGNTDAAGGYKWKFKEVYSL